MYCLQNGENEISSDKITAYKNDLDYLDDNFQVNTANLSTQVCCVFVKYLTHAVGVHMLNIIFSTCCATVDCPEAEGERYGVQDGDGGAV